MSDETNLPTDNGQPSDSNPHIDTSGLGRPLPTDPVTPPPSQSASNGGNGEDFAALQAELETTKSKLAELTQISQQALADLQNYRKRSEEEKIKFVAFANAGLISDLLPVLDNIDRAAIHVPEDPTLREWAEGIINIFKKLTETLNERGLEVIATLGQKFDPNLHEAVMTENGPQDQIIKELEKGYRLNDRILRRSKVTVGNGSPAPADTAPSSSDSTDSPASQ